MEEMMTFDQLAERIETVYQSAQTSSVGAINRCDHELSPQPGFSSHDSSRSSS